MTSIASRITGSKAAKGAVVGAMAVAAIGLAAPTSSASHEANWSWGCRGYWYSTAGHGYCTKATYTRGKYQITYDCNFEVDKQRLKGPFKWGYQGKIDSYECTFKINKTSVGLGT
ncbi:hypothetical protein ACMZ5F_00660 [Streptomyces rhizosphaericola]|uniref:hypothetical protein n=1 Tax=Streptomyces rhizosphaericola TaxID=2564098 RepID=UPI0034722E03